MPFTCEVIEVVCDLVAQLPGPAARFESSRAPCRNAHGVIGTTGTGCLVTFDRDWGQMLNGQRLFDDLKSEIEECIAVSGVAAAYPCLGFRARIQPTPPMQDLTTGSVSQHLLKTTGFMLVTMIFQTLYFLIDLYWVGRLGKEAVAAVGIAGNLTFIVLALSQMLGVGTTALVAHAAGRKQH